MDIIVIDTNAKESLLALMEQSNQDHVRKKILHFQLSKLIVGPPKEQVLAAIQSVFADIPSKVFFLRDNDVAISWGGSQRTPLDVLLSRLYESFDLTEKDLHKYYDLPEDIDEAKAFYRRKLGELGQLETVKSFSLTSTPQQVEEFRKVAQARDYRDRPEILIVEDQIFSANLLSSMTTHKYTTYKTASAEEAWKFYLDHAPDIAFVDIELPGINGLRLVEEVAKIDPQAFIVMVTSHHSQAEVTRAKASGAKGFIIKPYSKQKILDAIRIYTLEKKSTPTDTTKQRRSDGTY